MRRYGTGVRGRRTAALVVMTLLATGALATGAQAADNPRSDEWHLDALHMPGVWQTSTGAGVTVAVIDSGVKADHPDIQGQLLPGKDFSGLPGGVDTDTDGHGTAMVSAIVGSGKSFGGQGATGLAPGAKVLPIKVNSSTAVSSAETLHEVSEGITYAADNGAKVISISLAMRDVDLQPSDIAAAKTAVDHAIAKGAVIFAGAGNSAQEGNPNMYPAVLPGVAAIAAVDKTGTHTSESEYGPQIALAAPGLDIYTACIDPSGYCKGHGTSFATALTSASAAIVWQLHPGWTGNQVLRVLIESANKPNDGSQHSNYIGFGNVSPSKAVQYTGDPGPADVNPLVQAGIGIAPSGAPSASPSGAVTPTPAPTPTEHRATGGVPSPAKSSSSNLPLILGGALVGLLVVVGLVVVLVRRNRAGDPPAPVQQGYPVSPQQQPYGDPQQPGGQGTPPANPYRQP
ncbi:S8 family serine peptidase [Kitasatospora sp. NPDC058965]|uniref:S8 family serine peptidase n=1 Tax=Kitasatospora sp. NPDC058965 TaxID=3346682 RepID=UPI0036B90F07